MDLINEIHIKKPSAASILATVQTGSLQSIIEIPTNEKGCRFKVFVFKHVVIVNKLKSHKLEEFGEGELEKFIEVVSSDYNSYAQQQNIDPWPDNVRVNVTRIA